jgi:hypothetical protein
MIPKELGKSYLVVFCKGCGSGFRVREHPLFERTAVDIREPETRVCPGCQHSAEYQPREMRVAVYQKEGLGRHKGAQ